ncbi:hypothetical protein V491_00688, partial [Pseudogymnoascus sp. VKM F-3775]
CDFRARTKLVEFYGATAFTDAVARKTTLPHIPSCTATGKISSRCRSTIFAFGSTLILVVLFVLFPRPVVAIQICHSSLRTSRAYVSAEALSNNIDDFCLDVTNKEPLITMGWTWSKTYYRNTPEEYAMTITISNRAFSSYQNQCIDAMRSIINGCDVPVNGSNPMNWKQGGKRVQGVYTYRIDIFRQNRPWPPPTQPKQSCEGWYKIIWQHYDIYGAGWANNDWGAKLLLPAINPCCGLVERSVSNSMLTIIRSLTGWNFKYFDQPDENGYEWHSWFNTATVEFETTFPGKVCDLILALFLGTMFDENALWPEAKYNVAEGY